MTNSCPCIRGQCSILSDCCFLTPASASFLLEPVDDGCVSTETVSKDVLCHWQCRHYVRPSCVEGKVSEYFGCLSFRQPVIHRLAEMECDLRNLDGSHQRAHRNQ